MTIRQLEYFIIVCEKKSLSKAAAEVYLSPQALSKAITELENECEVELFLRTSSGMQLTRFGEYLLEELEDIYPRLLKIPQELKQLKASAKDKIRMAVGYGITSSLSPDIWINFKEAYPNITLDITDQPDIYCEEMLASRQVDLICTIGPVSQEKFYSYPVKSEQIFVAIHNQHPLYNKAKISPEDFKEYDFIHTSNLFRSYYNFIDCCRNYDFEPRIIYTSNEYNLLQEMNEKNQGLFMMPEHTISPDVTNLRYYPFPKLYWRVCIATRKNDSISIGVDILINYIKNKTPSLRAQKGKPSSLQPGPPD